MTPNRSGEAMQAISIGAVLHFTQEAFAELSGIGYKYYQQVEAGRKREVRLSTLERLAHAYGIEVYQLLAPDMPATKLTRRVPKKSR